MCCGYPCRSARSIICGRLSQAGNYDKQRTGTTRYVLIANISVVRYSQLVPPTAMQELNNEAELRSRSRKLNLTIDLSMFSRRCFYAMKLDYEILHLALHVLMHRADKNMESSFSIITDDLHSWKARELAWMGTASSVFSNFDEFLI